MADDSSFSSLSVDLAGFLSKSLCHPKVILSLADLAQGMIFVPPLHPAQLIYCRAFLAKVGRMKLALWISAL